MKPTPFEWLLASRFTLPIWLGLAAYVWFSHGGDWNAFTPDQQLVITIAGGLFAVLWLKSFPTVFFFEREQAAIRKSAISPEERWQRQTVAQTFFLVLVAIALIYFGLQWWKSAPEPQPTTTKAALSVGSAGVLATTAYLKVKSWRSHREAEQPAIVSWCLPVPTHSPSQQEIRATLPAYCRQVLATGDGTSPVQGSEVQPEVKHEQSAGAVS